MHLELQTTELHRNRKKEYKLLLLILKREVYEAEIKTDEGSMMPLFAAQNSPTYSYRRTAFFLNNIDLCLSSFRNFFKRVLTTRKMRENFTVMK